MPIDCSKDSACSAPVRHRDGLSGRRQPCATVAAMWTRFARALSRFRRGVYYSDVMLRDTNEDLLTNTFKSLLSMFVRGKVHVHDGVDDALRTAGFAAALLDPRDFFTDIDRAGAAKVRIIEAEA